MSTQVDKGNQTLNQKVGSRLDPQTQNKLLHEVIPTGVYSGFTLSVVDDSTAEVSPGEAILEDSSLRHTIHLHTDSPVEVIVNETSPYIILFWQFENREDNYVDFTITDNPGTDAVVLGKAEFDNNGNLTGFDTSNSNRDRVDLTNADQLDGLEGSDFLDKSTYDSNDNGKVDNAESADEAANAANANDADTVDGFDASQLLSSSGGTVVDTRDLVYQAASDQTDFTIDGFDAKLEKEMVVSGGVGPLVPGSSDDYVRVDPETTVQNSSRSDNGDIYTIRGSKVSYDSNDLETTIPVVEGVSDSTVDGDLDLQGSDYVITDVNTDENEFVVNSDARAAIADTVISFNSGRTQDEVIYILILTYIEQGHLNGFNADLLDGKHAGDLADNPHGDAQHNVAYADDPHGNVQHDSDFLDKSTYDSNDNGKVDNAESADQADNATSANDADTVDGKHAGDLADNPHGDAQHSDTYVDTSSDQTVGGNKTFNQAPEQPNASSNNESATLGQVPSEVKMNSEGPFDGTVDSNSTTSVSLSNIYEDGMASVGSLTGSGGKSSVGSPYFHSVNRNNNGNITSFVVGNEDNNPLDFRAHFYGNLA